MPINRGGRTLATRIPFWLHCAMSLGFFFESMFIRLAAESAPAAANIAIAQAPPARTIDVDGEKVPEVGFERLASFPYTIVDAGTGATPIEIEAARKRDQVPPSVRALDGKRVAITGFMLPMKLENGRAKTLFLMRDVTTCCYGATPNMNDYVVVTMKGEGVKAMADLPVVLVGVLRIGERFEGGYLVSLYELDGEKFLGPRK